jgi:hypothetical protein
MVVVPPAVALLVMVSAPVIAPAVEGSKLTTRDAVWLGLSVSGKLAPDTVKPLPVIAAALIVSA